MDHTEDVECVRKGKYLVIKDTNVVVHETEDRMLGILVMIENEWMLVVPETPTKDMMYAYDEYNYELPTVLNKEDLVSELQSISDEITSIQSKLHTLQDITTILVEAIQKKI